MDFLDVLFVDIETVSQYKNYAELPQRWKELWNRKAQSLIKQPATETAETVYNQAALYPEFGKIVCISISCIVKRGEQYVIVTKSFSGDDEKQLLMEAAVVFHRSETNRYKLLCGHHGVGFDFPYIRKRMKAHGIQLPAILNIQGKKPWEVHHIKDTMLMWQEGDNRSFVSLDLLSAIYGIDSPKDDIDGSQVGKVYWEDEDLDRIVTYCDKDTQTLAKVYCAMTCEEEMEFEIESK